MVGEKRVASAKNNGQATRYVRFAANQFAFAECESISSFPPFQRLEECGRWLIVFNDRQPHGGPPDFICMRQSPKREVPHTRPPRDLCMPPGAPHVALFIGGARLPAASGILGFDIDPQERLKELSREK